MLGSTFNMTPNKASLSFASASPNALSSSSCVVSKVHSFQGSAGMHSEHEQAKDLLVYPSHKLLCIYDVHHNCLLETWKRHKAPINACSSFCIASNASHPTHAKYHYIASVDADGMLIIWNLHSKKPIIEIQAHKHAVSRLSILHHHWIACVSANHEISLWKINVDHQTLDNQTQDDTSDDLDSFLNVALFQRIELPPNNIMECCDMCYLDTEPLPQSVDSQTHNTKNRVPILACAGIDTKVHLFILHDQDNSGSPSFKKVCALQGSSDWIRDMKFIKCDDGTILLATACQDTYIRVWKLKQQLPHNQQNDVPDDLDLSNIDLSTITAGQSFSLSRSSHMIQYGDKKWSIMLETILSMHEDWVHSLDWAPPVEIQENGTTRMHQPIRLLSASMDRTMIVWQPDLLSEEARGVWNSVARMGSFGGKVGLTGQMGYLTARFLGTGNSIIAQGYHGSFHYWKRTQEESNDNDDSQDDDTERWIPQVSVTGHFSSVMDVDWDPSKRYFLSTSSDQTTRLFAPWNNDESKTGHSGLFYEIARPQIHGYDMNCVVTVKGSQEHRYVSGADEKVIRVFDAPLSFVQTYKNISKVETQSTSNRVESAEIPAIGLSNKSVSVEDEQGGQLKSFDAPPFEEQLLKDTLWPELCKMFGHANEISCVASSNDGKVIASACQARKEDEAEVRLWDTSLWEESCVLDSGHRTTVTRIEFSPSDTYMISVSRDMNLIFYERNQDSHTKYKPILKQKLHNRLILDCSWSHDEKYILTASRDKTIRVWMVPEGAQFDPKQGLVQVFENKFKQSVSSVAFCHESAQHYLLALGLANGEMEIWIRNPAQEHAWKKLTKIASQYAHADTVKRLRWRQNPHNENTYDLLTCSLDRTIRLYSVPLEGQA